MLYADYGVPISNRSKPPQRKALHRPAYCEGKAIVARNSVTHGLSANKFALLPWEDPAEWEELLNGLIAEHQPSTPTEEFLVHVPNGR